MGFVKTMGFVNRLLLFSLTLSLVVSMAHAQDHAHDITPPKQEVAFDHEHDLISLHYDHAPDKDDGHSAAADRTILETKFGTDWIKEHVIPVSGAYGTNRDKFNPNSDVVMSAAWDRCGGWLSADKNWDATVEELAMKWIATIKAGGAVWIKEGGQSDITADVVQKIRQEPGDTETTKRIHLVQHSLWNEEKTTKQALAFVKQFTDYIKISDANRYLNMKGGDADFFQAAKDHPVFGRVWQAAFDYYDPNERLDFSDTGELMYILGSGEIGIKAFQERFLSSRKGSK